MARPDRGPLLTVSALLMGLLAISNFSKPFAAGPGVGFVFLGHRLSGTPNAIIGPLFGLYLLLYAIGIWRMRRYALPMGIGYTVYVVLNLILFTVRDPTTFGNGLLFGLVYSVVAIGVSSGAAYLLAQRRAALT
jgi:hypothetical protein